MFQKIKDPKFVWFITALFISVATGFFAGERSVNLTNQTALFATETSPFVPEPRVKEDDCAVRGPLPDPECTPGAIFPDATAEKICVSGYTKTVRKVSTSLKKRVYRAYGVPYPPPFGSYELDHYIPLALGGSNDIANLWPFAAEPRPGFIEKDLTVNYLHRKVCAQEISLAVAQRAITVPWVEVYNSISAAEKEELRRMFPSWAETRRSK
ncbi:MAG: hypothetical protein UY20_C0003G0043 [Candidatus Yanofskybacteria bacterium GW2011_GWA1_48_10]|uniref:HNH endonuclease n=2 Tax=Candidatus Yanofskyibacteriota TaxID=1752733 RepID=A0A0G1U7B9_9BACT|nr:MAG: hypothetical protein UY20_C0003G0043 [Candidatus Yanofskybacteria bacterium GW2011_GWA1_48_10]OGN06763.1 MAG: hypothetical protein A2669_00330 [Candidatus Yanofskybacteria bacterium RIFCSPHIGHO2_01_FULL_48_25b]